mmetsp:Transcript_70150/g.158633  ORF Transcript_70150/g.158633 Transcript_70150/m.158633 type:complete len:208 (-) Transcript_70150:2021-2644(-)
MSWASKKLPTAARWRRRPCRRRWRGSTCGSESTRAPSSGRTAPRRFGSGRKPAGARAGKGSTRCTKCSKTTPRRSSHRTTRWKGAATKSPSSGSGDSPLSTRSRTASMRWRTPRSRPGAAPRAWPRRSGTSKTPSNQRAKPLSRARSAWRGRTLWRSSEGSSSGKWLRWARARRPPSNSSKSARSTSLTSETNLRSWSGLWRWRRVP